MAALLLVAGMGRGANAQVTAGLIDYWNLNESSGLTAADSVGGKNLNLFNYSVGDTSWTPGIYGNGLAFGGSHYAITSTPITLGNQFSVSFWMKASYVNDGTNDVIITPQTQNWIYARPGSGVGIETLLDNRPTLYGVWEHHTITYDGTTSQAKIYLDGALSTSGALSLPTLTQPWVLGHNQDPSNQSSTLHGTLDDVKLFNRVLTSSEAAQLAVRPPPPADFVATLVAPAQSFGPQPTGQFAQAQATVFIDPANTKWIAWNRFPELRGMSDVRPGELFLGTQTPEIDDYFSLKITNPLGQTLTIDLDQNGVLGDPSGLQAAIFGTAANLPDVLRGNNARQNFFFDEAGAFNSIFTVPGNYQFEFTFRSIGGDAGFPDVYLLRQLNQAGSAVPEPGATLVWGMIALLGGAGYRFCRRTARGAG